LKKVFLVSKLNLNKYLQLGYKDFVTPYFFIYKELREKKISIEFLKPDHQDIHSFKFRDDLIKSHFFNFLNIIAEKLNQINDVNEENLFWERIIGFNLLQHIHFTENFYRTVKRIDSKKYFFQTLNLDNLNVPNNFNQVRKITQYSGLGTEVLMAFYFSNLETEKFTLNNFKSELNISKPSFFERFKKLNFQKFLNFVFKKLYNIFPYLLKIKYSKSTIIGLEVFFEASYFSQLKKTTKSKIIFPGFKIPTPKSSISYKNRVFFNSKNFNNYESFFLDTLTYFIPLSLYENFKFRKKFCEKYLSHFPNAKFILNESLSENTSLLISCASKFNIKHIYNEHNWPQHYLIGNIIWLIKRRVDIFYSLGWNDSKDDKIIPSGSLYKWSNLNKNNKNIDILFISGISQYNSPIHCSGYAESGGFNNPSMFFEMNELFFSSLNKNILNKIYYRGYPNPSSQFGNYFYSDSYLNKFKNHFKAIDYSLKNSGTDLISKSKLVVINYVSTPWLQSLISDVPTIIIVNLNGYFLVESEKNYFKILSDAKIVHHCPISAAKFINTIYSSPERWWLSENTQFALKMFLNKNMGNPIALINHLTNLA
jgi:putative transferase (TIGR04331 family)